MSDEEEVLDVVMGVYLPPEDNRNLQSAFDSRVDDIRVEFSASGSEIAEGRLVALRQKGDRYNEEVVDE